MRRFWLIWPGILEIQKAEMCPVQAQIERAILLGETVAIPFSQVEKVEFSHENNTTYYCFYVDGQLALKIMKLYEES